MTEAELLEAIWAAPDDDGPRLVYADALLERGDPRGEFIVRQCAGDPATELLAEHEERWLGSLSPIVERSVYRRGFLDEVWIRQPRDEAAIARLAANRLWRTVRRLVGSVAIALEPANCELVTLEVESEPPLWNELLTGTPRGIAELIYTVKYEDRWDQDGDVTATPQSGGRWTLELSHAELLALRTCSALPELAELAIRELPASGLGIVLGGGLLDRLRRFRWREGACSVEITRGVARVAISEASALPPAAVIQVIQQLPAELAIDLVTGPRFAGRAQLVQQLGSRLWTPPGR